MTKKTAEKQLTHDQKILWMTKWCKENGCLLELSGECGFGRECVGIVSAGNYPDYCWRDEETWDRIDDNGDVWVPEHAYHKHECVAVLGRGESAEAELYEWLKWFDDHGFTVSTKIVPQSERNRLDPAIFFLMGKQNQVRMVKR